MPPEVSPSGRSTPSGSPQPTGLPVGTGRSRHSGGPGRALALGLVAGLPFAGLTIAVSTRPLPLGAWEGPLLASATAVTRAHPALLRACVVWQEVFQPWHVYLVLLPGSVWWLWRRGLRSRARWGLATAAVTMALNPAMKLLVGRPRPQLAEPLTQATGRSFPSGHVFHLTAACAIYLVMAWPLLARHRSLRRPLVGLAIVFVLLTAADRVWLGVHFPSDTIAGASLASAVVSLSWAAGRARADRLDELDEGGDRR